MSDSLDYPDSLAVMGCVVFAAPAFQFYDLASMAVAQVWAGRSALPPAEEMARAVDESVTAVRALAAQRGALIPYAVDVPKCMAWEGVRFWLGTGGCVGC